MTEYQRGNRDGLTSFATQLRAEQAKHVAWAAERAQSAADARNAKARESLALVAFQAQEHAEAYGRAAELAEKAALALPDDPTPAPPAPR